MKEILDQIKDFNYHDLEYLVFRMQLTYDENMHVLDMKFFPSKKNKIYFTAWYL